MSAFPALALAVALTYALGDIYRPYVPSGFAYFIDLLLGLLIFRVTHVFLQRLKE